MAADRAYSGRAQLNVVPAYVLHHDPAFRAALAEHGADADHGLEAVELQHLTDPAQSHDRNARLPSPAALQKRIMAGRASVPLLRHRVVLIAHLRRRFADWPTVPPR
ncbi:hypothetical protein AB0F25_28200 [Streptomyces wedmorensis]|uniref:hypothetical protein n=1 Tax=Streptomyces wedmorensis TaxID=43759 RepID=UPI00342241D9